MGPSCCTPSNKAGPAIAPATAPGAPATDAPTAAPPILEAIEPTNWPACSTNARPKLSNLYPSPCALINLAVEDS